MITVGSEEWLALPVLNIPAIKARVDSGAKTSSIHAENIQPFTKDGKDYVRFEIAPLAFNKKFTVLNEAPLVGIRTIKSSSGVAEKRYVIATILEIGSESWEIEITLANRSNMEYNMLLGREAMAGAILVNPGAHCLLGEKNKTELGDLYHLEKKTEKSGLKVGILASNENLYSNRRLIEAFEARGHTVEFLNIQQCYIKLDTAFPEIRYRGGTTLNDLDIVVPRIRPRLTFYGCALLQQFEALNIYCQNSGDAIKNSRDKLLSSMTFAKNKIEIPITGFANSPSETKDLISMVNGAPLIIKLLEGTQGTGVVLAETNKAAESVINAFKSIKANILVQEFIKEAAGKDIRCFVVNGKVVAAMERVATKGEFRANVHRGGIARKVKLTLEEKKLAIKVAKVFGLDVAGVDLIRSNRGPLVLEVNSSPGLEGIENATGIDIADMIVLGAEKRYALNKK